MRSVDEIHIRNWQTTGSNVSIPQYQFDLEIKWRDDQNVGQQHSDTYRYPNDIASMPLSVRRRLATRNFNA